MKYTIYLSMTFFSFLMALVMFQDNVYARSYSVTNYDEVVEVKDNGGADVTQKITYDFKGKYKGVEFVQDIRGTGGGTLPKVTYFPENKNLKINSIGSSEELFATAEGNLSNEKVTFVYKYSLSDLVTNYKDTAQINWNVIGSEWTADLYNVNIVFKLPKRNISGLKAWTQTTGNVERIVDKESGTVTFKMAKNKYKTALSADIIFPPEVTNNNLNVVNKNQRNNIISSENNYVKEQKENQKTKQMIATTISEILAIAALLIYLFLRYRYKKIEVKKSIIYNSINHLGDVPDVSPSVAQVILYNERPDENAFTGDVLKELADQNIELVEDDKNFTINSLQVSDNYLLNYLINKIGNGQSVSNKDIEKYSKWDNFGRLEEAYRNWQRYIMEEGRTYFNKASERIVTGSSMKQYLIALLLIIINATMLIGIGWQRNISLPILVATVVFMLFVVIDIKIRRKKVTIYNDRGSVLNNDFEQLEKMFKNIDKTNLKDIGDIDYWAQIVPYATAFGLSRPVIDAVKKTFPDADIAESNLNSIFNFSNGYFAGIFAGIFISGIILGGGNSNLFTTGGTDGSSGGFGGGGAF
ncbi:DUF2207 domain-containing protein [Companilactobacillus metriopterae]|uniref:DUF2207 domain-containing protein n=1 Tax=Companilactobacillus metriopterae TaxID=1909267 RepID=UPI00100C162A|nr:DUF2207 domain-containing protein [Companilactobacillus metriopterae]